MNSKRGVSPLLYFERRALRSKKFRKTPLLAAEIGIFRSALILYLGEIERLKGNFKKSLIHLDKAQSYNKQSGSLLTECRIYKSMADCYFILGENAQALDFYTKIFLLAENIGNSKELADIKRKRGEFYRMSDHIEKAREDFEFAINTSKRIGYKDAYAWATLGLADLARITNQSAYSKDLYTDAINHFQEIHCLRGKSQALRGFATLEYALGNYSSAEKMLDECLTLSHQTHDKLTASRAYIWVGKISSTFGKYGKAREYYEKGIELCNFMQDRWGKAQLLAYLADIEKDNNHFEVAEIIYDNTLELSKTIGDQAKQAMALKGKGIISYQEENYKYSEILFKRALKIFEEIKHISGQAEVYKEIGQLKILEGDLKAASDFFQKSLNLADNAGDITLKISIWRGIGDVDFLQNRDADADRSYSIAYDLANKSSNPIEIGRTLLHWSIKKGSKGFIDEAISHATKALSFFMTVDNSLEIAKCFLERAKLYVFNKDYAKGLNDLIESKNILQHIGNNNLYLETLYLIGKLYIETNQPQEAKKYLTEAINISSFKFSAKRKKELKHLHKISADLKIPISAASNGVFRNFLLRNALRSKYNNGLTPLLLFITGASPHDLRYAVKNI